MEPHTTGPTNLSSHKQDGGSPYCYDPNCPYCKDLRETEDLVRAGKPVPQKMTRTA